MTFAPLGIEPKLKVVLSNVSLALVSLISGTLERGFRGFLCCFLVGAVFLTLLVVVSCCSIAVFVPWVWQNANGDDNRLSDRMIIINFQVRIKSTPFF